MSSAKGRKYPKTRCPECQLEMTEWGLVRHKKTRCWGNDVAILNEETKAIWEYWSGKKYAHTPEKQWLLTSLELMQLMEDAGITANSIGLRSHQYQLARHNDTGNYEVGNCRFIPAKENHQEQKSTKGIPLNHPRNRRTHTPMGSFNSLSAASRGSGIPPTTLHLRVKSKTEKMKEYYYE